MSQGKIQVGISNADRERFYRLKEESRIRLDKDEMKHAEFLSLLMDVWEDNLAMAREEFPVCPECESDVFVGNSYSDTHDFVCFFCDTKFYG